MCRLLCLFVTNLQVNFIIDSGSATGTPPNAVRFRSPGEGGQELVGVAITYYVGVAPATPPLLTLAMTVQVTTRQ